LTGEESSLFDAAKACSKETLINIARYVPLHRLTLHLVAFVHAGIARITEHFPPMRIPPGRFDQRFLRNREKLHIAVSRDIGMISLVANMGWRILPVIQHSFEWSFLSMHELTTSEIDQISGAWGPIGAAIGATGGATGYFLQNKISGGPWSWAEFGCNTAGGAAAGAVAGPAGVVWGFNGNVARGTITGVAQHYGW
jgi:hypothetical protein